jgi:glutamyl-Q tRNA(Asp) synthetase
MPQPVFRLAPSPNGFLHLGHAFSALLNQKMAQEVGGRLLLRLEDTDVTRCKPAFIAVIMEDLHWLGISWEEPVRVQSEHFGDYETALHKLWHEGHVYPCFCSRKVSDTNAFASTDPDGARHYGGTCSALSHEMAARRLEAGEAFGWRLRTTSTSAAIWGDVMIAKPKTGSWYHIAVVVDDALQGVTHVVRGADMESATPIHQLLQQRLSLHSPIYHHHRLILDENGQKLSKSLKSKSIRALREQGMTADDVREMMNSITISPS